MDYLKNIPTDTAKGLAEMIDIRPGRVVSMALSQNEDCQIMLMSFADGESVSQEQYFGDTLYYVLEGEMPLIVGEKEQVLKQGDYIAVPAGTLHAVGGTKPFKLMQITLK